mmetsp:Transcript_153702/g.268839  ORF Transcript_153702/g.268839 Transcript_153702/m.268839 type:complete len:91 (+) Transcript_153702:175-447(+)
MPSLEAGRNGSNRLCRVSAQRTALGIGLGKRSGRHRPQKTFISDPHVLMSLRATNQGHLGGLLLASSTSARRCIKDIQEEAMALPTTAVE